MFRKRVESTGSTSVNTKIGTQIGTQRTCDREKSERKRAMDIPTMACLRRTRQGTRVTAILFAVLALALSPVVEGFIAGSPRSCGGSSRQPPAHLYNTATDTSNNDVDVVGEGRRGDAKGAAMRLVDVAVSRGGSTLLSNIDWRVEPKSKWGLVVRV